MSNPTAASAMSSTTAAVHALLSAGRVGDALYAFDGSGARDALSEIVAMEIAAAVGDRERARAAFVAFKATGASEALAHEAGAALEWALGHPERAAAHDDWLNENLNSRRRWRFLLRGARRWAEAGETAKAVEGAERYLAWPDGALRTKLQAIQILWDAGQFVRAQDLLLSMERAHPDAYEPVALLARLELWRGAYDAATARGVALCAQDEQRTEGWRIQGAAAVCTGAFERAIPLLDKALACDGSDLESTLWRVEAQIRNGTWERGSSDIGAQIRNAGHIMVAVTRMWHRLHRRRPKLTWIWRRLFFRNMDPARGVFARLAPLATEAEWAGAEAETADARTLMDRILRSFRGNRSGRPTIVRAGSDPIRGDGQGAVSLADLEFAPLGTSPRAQSAEALRRLPQQGPEAVRAELAELAKIYPNSPHPLCYQGELELWMGELDAAQDAFESGNRRLRARWAYIGTMAVQYLKGETWAARRTGLSLRRNFTPLAASTLPVYRGEGARRAGKYDDAIKDLRTAIQHKPTRLGARINLVLSLGAVGRGRDTERDLQVISEQAPSLLWSAERALQAGQVDRSNLNAMTPILEHALVMMRANRSSTRLSYFDEAGTLFLPITARASRTLAQDLTEVVAGLQGGTS